MCICIRDINICVCVSVYVCLCFKLKKYIKVNSAKAIHYNLIDEYQNKLSISMIHLIAHIKHTHTHTNVIKMQNYNQIALMIVRFRIECISSFSSLSGLIMVHRREAKLDKYV